MPMPDSRWKEFRFRIEWLLCAALARFIPSLPRTFCVALANSLGWIAYFLDRRGRAVALANLAVAFGDRFNLAERKSIARRSYQNFARSMLDMFWSPRITPANYQKYIEQGGGSEWFRELRSRKDRPGCVMMCVHWGNSEWASLLAGFWGDHITIVTETFKNSLLSEIFSSARGSSGNTLIPQESSMIRLLKAVKRRSLAGILIDLTLRPDQPAVVIDAFGHKMCVTYLHAVLALRGGALLVPAHGEPLPGGRVRAFIRPPIEFTPDATPQEIAQRCWDAFEPLIRERPELWMWTYKHWRYRPSAAAPEDYPFYANVSSKFDKLLAAPPVELAKSRPPLTPSKQDSES